MDEIKKFQLEPLPVKGDEWEKSKLLYEGNQTDTVLSGISLEAQFQQGEKYILFVTYDSIFAETLHIYLLDKKLAAIDEWQISQNEAAVHKLQIIGDNQLQFSFFGDDSWVLTVLEKPQLTLPRLPLFSSYWKPLRFAFAPGYLQIEKK